MIMKDEQFCSALIRKKKSVSLLDQPEKSCIQTNSVQIYYFFGNIYSYPISINRFCFEATS